MARTSTKSAVKDVVVQADSKKKTIREKSKVPNRKDFISTGSTLLNLALTDHPYCGWQKGKMSNIIGDSSAGKTFLAFTAYAEANQNKAFNDYAFIVDDAEHANEFDMEYLFGEETAERIIAPKYNKDGDDINSETVEDFHDNLLSAIEEGKGFIYALDSFDALSSEADDDKIEEQRKARANDKDAKGSYGMAKAKKSSEILRHVVGKLEKTSSILLIISQTRDNLTPGSFEKKTRSGGKALKFYAQFELWLANGGSIKSKDRVIGVKCVISVKKNKCTGKRREVTIPIFYDYGIDDVGSMVDFLVEEKYWSGGGKSAIKDNGSLGLKEGTRASIIKQIEEGDLENKLREFVGKCWNDIEDSLRLNRKNRYE